MDDTQPNKEAKALPAKVDEEQSGIKNTDEEKKCVADLKKLYMKTINLNAKREHITYNMEKLFEERYCQIYDKRRQTLEAFKKHNNGEGNPCSQVTKFWFNVLKIACSKFISKNDENILTHLIDIRSKLCNQLHVKLVLEFYFETNIYFTNCLLTKTYYFHCLPSPKNPLSYDGGKVYKCEGCTIHWKNQSLHDRITEDPTPSFFDFFSPPELPKDPNDPNYWYIHKILRNDFKMGIYIKERLIPKAIRFFAGEIGSSKPESVSEKIEERESQGQGEGEEIEISSNENEK